jgi:hypothetical protein
MENRIYFLYYENTDDQTYEVYSSETKKISNMEYNEWRKHKKMFHMLPGFDATHEGLLEYAKTFRQWVDELKSFTLRIDKMFFSVDVLFYDSLHILTRSFFKRLSKGKFEHHTPMTQIELGYIDDCPNGGLIYCDESISDKYIESHSYDYSFDYPTCMSADKLNIPNKSGKEYKLKQLPKPEELKTGYYRVKITCENKNFRKLFAFSKRHTYADRSVYQAMKYQKEYDVKIELNQELKYNAYLYDDDDLERGKTIFGTWFRAICKLKETYPKNGIVKFMGSSLHGQLERIYELDKTEDEIIKEKLDIGKKATNRYQVLGVKIYGIEGESNYKKIYSLMDTENPQQINMRLKALLSAYVRNKTSRLVTGHVYFGKDAIKNVVHDLNQVIRIHTDCVTFKKKHDHLLKDDLKYEKKSSGIIKWVNASTYHNKTTGKYHGRW